MPSALTAVAVSAAKGREARYEMPDSSVGGLRLLVQPSGVKSWAVRYRGAEGKSVKLTLGGYPALDLKAARARALEALAAVASGSDPSAAKKAFRAAARAKASPATAETTAAAIELFMEKHARKRNRPATWKDAQRTLTRELAPWATRRLSDITPADIHGILDAKIGAGYPIAANRHLRVLSRFFRFAVERGLIAANPCAGIGSPAPTNARERVLTPEELAAVWYAAERLRHPFGPVVVLLLLTGQRRGEAGSIRAEDVDLERGIWTIPSGIAKNKRTHLVHLAPIAVDLLREAFERDKTGDFLFGGKTAPSGWSKAKRRLDALIGDAVREPWTLHDLRRSAATGMASLGIPVPVIESVLNHKSGTFAGIVGVYQRHEYLAERKEALALWADHLGTIRVPVASLTE